MTYLCAGTTPRLLPAPEVTSSGSLPASYHMASSVEQSMTGLMIKNMKNDRILRREPKYSHYDLPLRWEDPAPAACARSHFFWVIASFLPNDIKDRAKHDRINHQKHEK
jgi:hypothetical protein